MTPVGFLTFFIILKMGEATKSIYITQDRLPSDLIMITCTISGEKAISFKTYLHCPLADTNFCYKDCDAECRYENGVCIVPSELKSIEKCSRDVMADDHIRIQYTINTKNIMNRNGEWYCSFADVNSKSLKLNNIVREKISNNNIVKPTTKSKPKVPQKPELNVNNDKISKVPVVVVIPPAEVPIEKKDPVTEKPAVRERKGSVADQEAKDDFNFRMFITKYQVVIGIICLLSISVMLNFIFCIRDSLIKQFIDNIKNHNSSSKYLLFCICQSDSDSLTATSKLDRILSKETDYISNGASNCSKTDIFNIDSQRPLITSMYVNSDSNSNPPIKHTRSASLQYSELPPRMMPVGYDPCYMTTPRGYTPYVYNPYLMNKNQLGQQEMFNEQLNQRHSYIFPSQIIPLDPAITAEMHNSKKHASENDIDLIRYCDDQLPNETN